MSEDEENTIECDKCGKSIDLEDAHRMDYGFGPWPKYGHTCKECMEKHGTQCAKCGEYFYDGEGIVASKPPSWYDITDEERKAEEEFDDKFLCDSCFDEVFYGWPSKEDQEKNNNE